MFWGLSVVFLHSSLGHLIINNNETKACFVYSCASLCCFTLVSSGSLYCLTWIFMSFHTCFQWFSIEFRGIFSNIVPQTRCGDIHFFRLFFFSEPQRNADRTRDLYKLLLFLFCIMLFSIPYLMH